MRPLRSLAFGLALIALWGICLQLIMLRWQGDSEPARLLPNSNLRPLQDLQTASPGAEIRLVSYEQDTGTSTGSGTAPVPLTVADVIKNPGTAVTVISVQDGENVGPVWSKPALNEAWVRSERIGLQLQIETPKVYESLIQGEDGKLTAGPQVRAETKPSIVVRVPSSVGPQTYLHVDLSNEATPKLRITFQNRVPSPWKLHVSRPPNNLPSPAQANTIKLGTYYPVEPVAGLSGKRLAGDVPTRVELDIFCQAATERLHVIQVHNLAGSTTGGSSAGNAAVNKIVNAVSSIVVGGGNRDSVSFQIDPAVKSVGQLVSVELEIVAEHASGQFSFATQPITLVVAAPGFKSFGNDSIKLARVTHRTDDAKSQDFNASKVYYTTNQFSPPTAKVTCDYAPQDGTLPTALALFANGKPCATPVLVPSSRTELPFSLNVEDGLSALQARVYRGEAVIQSFELGYLDVKTNGFQVRSIGPNDFGSLINSKTIFIDFNRTLADSINEGNAFQKIQILYSATGDFDPKASTPLSAPQGTNAVAIQGSTLKLTYGAPQAGSYLVRVLPQQWIDSYGNLLEDANGRTDKPLEEKLGGTVVTASAQVPVTPGVTRGQAPIVNYPPFVEPGQQPKGFNPNDHVETRVARLYFYRDAHRVAQILNRRAQSYNRQDVTMRRQFADKARQEADSLTSARQMAERAAVEQAKRTRELENRMSDAQRSMNYTLQQMQSLARAAQGGTPEQIQAAQTQLAQLESASIGLSQQIQQLESQIRAARDAEVDGNERMQQAQRGEELARAEQFRLETAAAHSDPDTFAAGDPSSIDQVAQVSISVIGEGLIHLRGPLRGVNQVRIMIDQMDAPCGQTRINIHSTQINGEEADKLEIVANRIQTYIDQARFLTMQSGELLRKAVVHAASMKAEEARGLYPGETQADRDQRYLYAFFGRDFAEELKAMDSEFLRSGNKLLALHSMDVTSLSSALMLLALANNGTRQAILEEFDQLLKTELPQSEAQYIHNGIGCCTNGCKPGCKHHKQSPPLCYLSRNATFTSLRGFFNTQMSHDDTMSPLQREMIRLAQILKARLITEMEYKQRVMERGLIEERLDSAVDSNMQLDRERRAQASLVDARDALNNARAFVIPATTRLIAIPDQVNSILTATQPPISDLTAVLRIAFPSKSGEASIASVKAEILNLLPYRVEIYNQVQTQRTGVNFPHPIMRNGIQRHLSDLKLPEGQNFYQLACLDDSVAAEAGHVDKHLVLMLRETERQALEVRMKRIGDSLVRVRKVISPFHDSTSDVMTGLGKLEEKLQSAAVFISDGKQKPVGNYYAVGTIDDILEILGDIEPLVARAAALRLEGQRARETLDSFIMAFSRFEENAPGRQTRIERATAVYRLWSEFTQSIEAFYETNSVSSSKSNIRSDIDKGTEELNRWMAAIGKLDAAYALAQDSRRPLDHKKFLDMLIDDLEEKYIELLEGTRAHTANIDNYLKRLTTALDDDFNTQFYFHAFRLVREASQTKNVTFGQTETTNVLANNRELGKVSPAATMEFDLPKRDILIREGMDAALATYNDLGALVNDPNLMALAKLNSGQSSATPAPGSLGGYGAVRSVYPGLNTDVSGRLINQNAGSGPEFESNVEKLIPDPAIYKFETGTGFEIRPVIAPDGQAVVFDFNYMYTTQIREPVRADEKHLGRVKQHFIDTDVQLSNFELREVSRYVVALRASRTAKGVPLLEDIPVVGALWRPLPSDEKSLQQNIIMAQATIFPTLFDLMGLRWAQAVSDLDPLRLSNREYLVRSRHRFLENRVYDYSSASVDEFLRVPEEIRRTDLYRSQETIPSVHPNGYRGPGLDIEVSAMREGFNPEAGYTPPGYIPGSSPEGAPYLPGRPNYDQLPMGETPVPMPVEPPRMQLAPARESSSRNRAIDPGWESKRIK